MNTLLTPRSIRSRQHQSWHLNFRGLFRRKRGHSPRAGKIVQLYRVVLRLLLPLRIILSGPLPEPWPQHTLAENAEHAFRVVVRLRPLRA